MNLTMRQLETLAVTARSPTFSAAARTLGISQPALSGMIKKLEAEIGVRLFQRTTRNLALTADGRHIAAIAEEAARDFKDAVDSIAARGLGRRGRLALAVLPSVACAVLPGAIGRFRTRFPGIEIGVHDVLHERAEAMVRDGVADLAVTIQPTHRDELSFEELGADDLRLVCRKGDTLARGAGPVPWSALSERPFVALSRNSSVRRMSDSALVDGYPPVQATYEVEQIPSAVALVRAGLGVTALPTLTFAMFASGGLVHRPLIGPVVRRRLGAVLLKSRIASPPLRSLLDELRGEFRRVLAGRRT